ncbi:MAG: DUF4199 domain-containing protein [Spirosomaceae bacterium]|jgi:hypothetical protein|nr:DUF4199 domain-containing protein [Spirosomataceae bacterium]
MKKIIFTNGLISGGILAIFLVSSMAYCYSANNFEGNMLVGYASMILAFSTIFIGIRNFRDKQSEGSIKFGAAFRIGAYISLIASTIYVLVWLIDYYFFIPDFMDKYSVQMLKQYQASGISATDLSVKQAEMDMYKDMYKNPIWVVLLTYMEILPIGLVISVISALILKRK